MADLSYDYTQISSASTPPDFSTLVPNLFANPSINNEGYVSYEALVGTPTDYLPPSAIYSSNGSSPPTALVNTSSYQFTDNTGTTYNSGIFYSPSNNDSGTTVIAGAGYNFGAAAGSASGTGPTAIITNTNGSVNNVAYQSTPFVNVPIDPNVSLSNPANVLGAGSFVSAPGINNAGTVAYVAGNSDGTTGIYTKNINSAVNSTIADSSGNFKDFYLGGLNVGRGEGPFSKYTLPAINDNGEVAFNADLKTGERGIFVSNNGKLTTIADSSQGYTYFSVPEINNKGTVAFNAGLANGSSAIFESTGGQLTTIADTNGIFKDFKSDVALNEQGQVAFLADLKNGTTAIYTGSDLGLKQVIAVGDPLNGSTVSQLFVSHRGLNDLGQVTFDAVLANGYSQEVFRADPIPVPEPSSIPLLGLAILGMVGYRWRRRRQ